MKIIAKISLIVFMTLAIAQTGGDVMALELKSPAFNENEFIPEQFTCKGKDISPKFTWRGAPENTKSFVLICDDPDAPVGTWVHWVIYDIPSFVNELSEGIPSKDVLDNNIKQGRNDFGNIGYGGPCPPPGAAHRYFFKLYALDILLNLKSGLTKKEVLKAIDGHILSQTHFIGKFKR